MAEISKDAAAVLANAGNGAQDYVLGQGGFGGKLTSGEAARLLTGFNPTITPQQVYSASNIQQAATSPAAAPNYSDPYALRDYFMNSSDLVAQRNAVAEANKALLTAKQTGRAQQQAIKELPQALNVIRGEQAVAGEQAALSEQAAAETLLASQSTYDTLANEANARYGIAQNERAKLQDLIKETGGKAGISYADSFESALSKASTYIEKKAKDDAKKAEKEKLTSLALSAGISTKGLSSKELRSKLEKKAKKDADLADQLNSLKIQSAQLGLEKDRIDIQRIRSEIGSGGSKADDKKTDQFFSDVEKQRAVLEAATKTKDKNEAAWSTAFKYLNTKYPEFTSDEIDSLLGLDYRKYFEGN